jgi:hypothetical protein
VLLGLCARILRHVVEQARLQAVTSAHPAFNAYVKAVFSSSPEDYLAISRERRLFQMLASRLRKETSVRVLYSPYLQTMVALLVQWQSLRDCLRLGSDFDDCDLEEDLNFLCWHEEEAARPTTAPGIIVEEATSTSITVSWGGWFPEDALVGGPAELREGASGGGEVGVQVPCGVSRGSEPRTFALQVAACSLWGTEPFTDSATGLKEAGTYTLDNLDHDTKYRIRLHEVASPAPTNGSNERVQAEGPEVGVGVGVGVGPGRGQVTTASTRPEKLFMLNAEAKAPNLVLSNGSMTVGATGARH